MFTLPREDKGDCKRKMLTYTGLEAKVGECGQGARRRPGCCETMAEPRCDPREPFQPARSLNAQDGSDHKERSWSDYDSLM